MQTPSGWQILDEERALLVRTYSIGPGNTSNCTVARIRPGELVVISPATNPDDAALRELEPFGRVTAIVAPNGFHRSGTPAWAKAFPDAQVLAPARALPRVRAVAPAALDVATTAGTLSDGVALLTLPGMRYGETWMVVQAAAGPVWCVSDTLTNLSAHPFGMGWIMRLLGIGLGLGLNGAQARFMALDKPAYAQWLRERIAQGSPALLVPAHGALVRRPDLGDRLEELFARL